MYANPIFCDLINKYGLKFIVNALRPCLTDRRKERAIPVLDNRLNSVHLAIENPADVYNAFAIMRTCEAFGVINSHIIGHPQTRKGRKTMQGAGEWVNLRYHDDLREFLQLIESEGISLVGATPHAEMTIDEVSADRPLCLVVGNERDGLSEELLSKCHSTFRIPMFGFTQSFNISVSAGISLYELTRRRRQVLGQTGDLTDAEKLLHKAWYYVKTLGIEKSKQIIEINR